MSKNHEAPSFPDPLIVFALKLESQDVFESAGVPVLYCGIGKVNAAMTLTRRLAEYRNAGLSLPTVLNFGSAGSATYATGALVACNKFVQRDMDVSGLGFDVGVTPFEDAPAMLEFPVLFAELPNATCGTGDSFETGCVRVSCDVVDMEAYALAKVCWIEGAAFGCLKYITDGADHDAAKDWQQNLHKAADEFYRCYSRLTLERLSRR
jgi:adenosylhomocysteine nucleosidase